MKALLVVASFITMTNVALAKNNCEEIHHFASVMMEARQLGAPLTQILKTTETITDATSKKWARNVILDAYEMPRFNTKKMQDNTISDFADKYALACEKGNK